MFIPAIPQLEAGKMVAMGGMPGEDLRRLGADLAPVIPEQRDGTEPEQKDTPTLGAVSYQSEYSSLMLIRGKAGQKYDNDAGAYKFAFEVGDVRYAMQYLNTDVFETVGVAQFIDGLWYVVVNSLGGTHFVVAGGYQNQKTAQEQMNNAFNRYLLDMLATD